MKKVVSTILAATLLSTAVLGSASAASIKRVDKPSIEVLINGKKMSFPDARPFSDENERVLVPIRFVSQSLGAKVDWTGSKSKTVKISMNNKDVTLVLGQSTAKVNGVTKTFDTKAIAKNSRVFVPLRFVSEALGQNVDWDKEGSWVWIANKEIPKVEDVAKSQKFSNFAHYFKGGEDLAKDTSGNTFTSAFTFSVNNLPLRIKNSTIYDIWMAKDSNGVTGIQIRFSGDLFHIYYLTDTFSPRYRSALKDVTTLEDGTKIASYKIVDTRDKVFENDANYKRFNLNKVKYIGFNVFTDTASLLSNPFAK